jgi:hypothetical protein
MASLKPNIMLSTINSPMITDMFKVVRQTKINTYQWKGRMTILISDKADAKENHQE